MRFMVNYCLLTVTTILAILEASEGTKLHQLNKNELNRQRAPISPRIFGGYSAKGGDFPSFVSYVLDYNATLTTFCSGVLISDQLVLTAAQCIHRASQIIASPGIHHPYKWMRGKVGLKNLRSGRKACWPRGFILPPSVSDAMLDYGIIHLSKPVKLSTDVQPAMLPEKQIKAEDEAFTLGVGKLSEDKGGGTFPDVLQVLPVKLANCSVLSIPLPTGPGPFESAICFQYSMDEYPGFPLSGDLGGPVLARRDGNWRVYGIISSGGPPDPALCMNVHKDLGLISDLIRSASESGDKTYNNVTCRELESF